MNEVYGEGGSATDVRRGVVGYPSLQWGRGDVHARKQKEDRAVADLGDGRTWKFQVRPNIYALIQNSRTKEHCKTDNSEDRADEGRESTASQLVGNDGRENRN